MKSITIHRARLHNLKNIDITFPKDKFVVITGVSGSGKSTLAFDILFEAGRKSYLQAIGILSALGEDIGFDQITGLSPAVAIKQSIIRQSNPRSVVGTKTKLLNFLGMLFADYSNRQLSIDEAITTAHFSFNSPMGMCLQCQGRGYLFTFDFSVLLPDKSTTVVQLYQNALAESAFKKRILRMSERYKFDLTTPFQKLPESVQNIVLYGQNPDGSHRTGLHEHLQRRLLRGKENNHSLLVETCSACTGLRISEEAKAVKINGKHIGELGQMTIHQLDKFFQSLQKLTKKSRNHQSDLSEILYKKITGIVDQLIAVKLDYLTLYRPIPTLSGGELQRLFLMSYLTTDIESLLYIFDEPTAGLHEIEKHALLKKLQALRAQGNALIVVEHDGNSIAAAEYIIDIGPLAGKQGGEIVYQGTYAGLLRCKKSITGSYLSGKQRLPVKAAYATIKTSTPQLKMSGVKTNNLQSISVNIPLRMMVGVAGVSGSGKSSLIADTLVPALHNYSNTVTPDSNDAIPPSINIARPTSILKQITGMGTIDRCAEISQAPIGRRSNSNPVTYLGIWSRIRQCFARQALAKERGYSAGHFSFNAHGACKHCQGNGQHRMWLGGTFVNYECEVCKGQRYQTDILDIRFRGHCITEILQLTAAEAIQLFTDDQPITRMLDILIRTGMGYITLGQPTSTLSGGEAQRIKLAKEIGRQQTHQHTLFVLDEPTTGLSLYDIDKLLVLLDELVARNNSVIIIEHDPNVLSHCDWLLEIGPGSGHQGGKVIAKGSPLTLFNNSKSLIGPFLTPAKNA